MAFCTNCGQKLSDSAKFCPECGLKINTNINSNRETSNTVFEGKIHKCSQCGEVLKSFTAFCPACGQELRETKGSASVREFAAKIEAIESKRPVKGFSLTKRLEEQTEISKTDKEKISLISSFVIPNTKEDLIEFLLLASSNINLRRYDDFNPITESAKAVSDAWEAKFEQAYEKARLSFGDTPEFKQIQSVYDKKIRKLKSNKVSSLVAVVVLFVVLFLVAFGSWFGIFYADNKKIEVENERLEVILAEVYEALDDENYTLARAKVASLTFSGTGTVASDEAAEKWDTTRKELLLIIDQAEKER